jgi:site-specific DNA-methyltransferase (adenine-specific)
MQDQLIKISTIKLEESKLSHIDPDELRELSESIRDNGLLHPITVQRLPYNGDADCFELVAGHARLLAVQALTWTEIPARVFPPNMTPERVTEVHLHENLKRQNLPWWKVAELELALHELRIAQKGQRDLGTAGRVQKSEDKKWSISDTARELGKSLGAISEDLTIAKVLRDNPSLRKVKDRDTAIRLIRQNSKRELAKEESALPSDFEMNQLFCGDSLDILKQIPDLTFDVCITDPPWLLYKDDSMTRDLSTIEVFREVYRVLKHNAFLYAIMSPSDFPDYISELTKMGYSVQKYPIIWDKKGTITRSGRRPWEYARDYEPILVAVKGSPVLTSPTELSSILSVPPVHPTKLIHPHEKPPELLKRLMLHSTYEGAKILDPFAGSGATLVAAKNSSREFIGIERDHKFYEQIKRRLD